MASKIIRFFFIFLVCCGPALGLRAQALAPTPEATASPAEEIYHRALNAYLDGNYDQAILLSAQSLEKDPSYQKSKNLLSVLTGEKEQEGKTVIWLAGKPSIVPAPVTADKGFPDALEVKKDVHTLQTKFDRFYGAQTVRNSEMNGQIQTIQSLVTNNSAAQYDELKKSQVEIYKQLEQLNNRGQNLFYLYLLCGFSVVFSVLSIWKKSQK